METKESILNTVKNLLGLAPDYTPFDLSIITFINTAFGTLHQLGIGPTEGFEIDGESSKWEDFEGVPLQQMNKLKTYITMYVRMLFDPPTTSFAITAMEKQVEELAWRLNVDREETAWVPGGS